MKTPEEFLEENNFTVAEKIDRQAMIATFLSEMEKGLKGEPSSLRMIPTYVGVNGKIPQGAKAAVLDAGGTNFRSAVVSIPPTIEDKMNQPMAGAKSGDATPELDAKPNCWTKGIRAPMIVGQYVGKELLKRLGGGEIAIVNDTVATLLAAKATEGAKTYASYLGFMRGTGTNTAYVEMNRNLVKLQGLDPSGSMIINAESGSFDKLAQSNFDKAMDQKTQDPGHNPLEKMIAGGYLGGVGLELYKAAAKAGLFSAKAASAIGGIGALETMDLDNFCAAFKKEGRDNPLDAIFADPDDAKMARRLGIPVFERAAVLTAIHLAAFCIKSGEGADDSAPIAINADGSTYYKTCAIPFADTVKKELDDMLVQRRNIHYCITPRVADAPMVGAAIAAML